MALVSEKYHKDKLKKYNLNIKTKYIVGNEILERNTDDSYNDDINLGIRCEKDYYINNILNHQEKLFDSRIEYTYIYNETGNKKCECPNCGMKAKQKDFIDGCPYCQTYYNIDYTEKDLGGKYHYDLVIRKTNYRIITAIIDFIISLIISFFFIKYTSRTFNIVDITKVFIYGIVLTLILYYFFYIMDAYVILTPIKKYKEKQNQKQKEFWDITKIDKKTFFNNLNYEIRKKYYREDNIIDYDIIDYLEFKDYTKNNKLYVEVTVDIRLVYFNNNKITSKYITDTYIMTKYDKNTMQLKEGTNIISCPNCGKSIDITNGKCEYCNTEVNYFQEWIMITKNNNQ